MSWNYRVMRSTEPDGTHLFAIHEVYYTESGAVKGWTENAAWPSGETFGELTRDIAKYERAFIFPVIAVLVDGLYEIGRMGKASHAKRIYARATQDASAPPPTPGQAAGRTDGRD